ncbi:MAG: carbohydrate ABC transporter permease [Firmicutes bacterium]|nr:carbohydrate ABC transporter permease [Bacillota bacterium]
MLSGSFKTSLEIQSADITDPDLAPRWIPRTFTLDNYRNVNRTVRILDYFMNSIIVSIGTMLLCLALSILAGYSLARFEFKGKGPYVLSLLVTQMFPGILFLIPYFILFVYINKWTGIQLKNTYAGLILTYASFALPFSILMLRSFFATIPREIDEQAQIDGCTPVGALFRVIIPVAKPGIAAVGIYAFIMSWNEILFASLLTGRETKTVAVGILEYITNQEARWAGMMAACIIVTIPVLVLFTLIQRHIVEGLVSGSVKG